jgi:hypothetical protein
VNGACSEAMLSAARIPDIFFASRRSLISDPEKNKDDIWAEPLTLVEPRTFVVANQDARIGGCAALRSESCRASEVCRERRFCVARDGECRP